MSRAALIAAVVVIAFALVCTQAVAQEEPAEEPADDQQGQMTPVRVIVFQGIDGGPGVGGAIGAYLGIPRERTRPTGIADFFDAARDNAKLDLIAVGGHLGGGLSTTLLSDIGPCSLGFAATTSEQSGYFGFYLDTEAYKLLVGNAPMGLTLAPVKGEAADGSSESGWMALVQVRWEFD